MWSFGRYCLKLTEKAFWSLTLAQFNALAERFISEQESLNYRAALVCSVIAEVNRDRKKRTKPFTPQDFMPKKKKAKLTGEQTMEQIKVLNTMLGGEVK